MAEADEVFVNRHSTAQWDLFENYPVPMWVFDVETLAFLHVNRFAVEHYGYTREEFLAMTIRDIRPAEDIEQLEAVVARNRDLNVERGWRPADRGKWRHTTKNGRVLNVLIRGADIVWEGRRAQLIVAHDVTDVVNAERVLIESEQRYKLLAERFQTTLEEQQAHLARAIHDEVGQLLTAIGLELSSMERHPERATPARLRRVADLASEGVQVVRHIAMELRPAMLDQVGLAQAVKWQAHEFGERSGISVDVSAPREFPRLGERAEVALFRILQEALTNVARHARAGKVRIELSAEGDECRLRVADDGVGIPEAAMSDYHSVGLFSMRERARLAGGECTIHPAELGGTEVDVRVSIQKHEK